LAKALSLAATVGLIASAEAKTEVGEIVSRPAPTTTQAMSVLQNARNTIQKRLANIAAQAEPLADAVAAYKTNPTVENALTLLEREAVVGGIGAKESETIATEAATVANACAGLAAQSQAAAEMLRPGLAKAKRAQAENSSARDTGLAELREVHRALLERGVTNEVSMSAAERRKVAMLLRLTGAAELSEQFVKMEVGATDAVMTRLNQMSETFATRQRNFEDLARAYQLHASSFKTVGSSVARVAQLIEINGRLDGEAKTAAELEAELARIDDVLGKTFEGLPEDFTRVFTPTAAESTTNSGSTGLWARLLRFLGIADNKKAELAQTERSAR
jgi:hypothetical protein